MTYEEAAEKIKEKICCEKPVQHFCTDDCRAGEEYCEFAMAIAAIDKQIPTPPKETNFRTLPDGTKIRSNRIRQNARIVRKRMYGCFRCKSIAMSAVKKFIGVYKNERNI